MPSVISQAFGEDANLYEILGAKPDCTAAQLRKAYYRKALQYHPDKNPNTQLEFQALSLAYDILQDSEKRAAYDEDGVVVEDDDLVDTKNASAWKDYFDGMFGKVTFDRISHFAQKYKCSDEEQRDVLKEYKKHKGNLVKMLDVVMLSEPRDCDRWISDYIEPAIEKGEVPDHKKTLQRTLKQVQQKEAKENQEEEIDPDETETDSEEDIPQPRKTQKRKATTQPKKKATSKKAKEAAQAEDLLEKIRNKNAVAKSNDSILKGLAARYGGTADEDPIGDDAAFAKIQAKILKKKK